MSDRQTESGQQVVAVVRKADTVEAVEVKAGTAARMQVLIGDQDAAPHFAMRRLIMGPGGGMPKHSNAIEHQQYVLRGRARVGIGDEVHEVAAGTVLLIPALVAHDYEVLEAPFEFLCLVPNLPDEITIVNDAS